MKQSSELKTEIEAENVLRKRPKRSMVSSSENSMENLLGAVDATSDNGIVNNNVHDQNNSNHPSSSGSSMGTHNAQFPKQYEDQFLSAIFELGLKNASPKLILPLLPPTTELNTEHIKSHLQKYRVHKERSKEEFVAFYTEHIKHTFDDWDEKRGWESGMGAFDGSYMGVIESKVVTDDIKVEKISNNGRSPYPPSHPLPPSSDTASYKELDDKVKELQRLQGVLSDSSRHVEDWMKICAETEEQTKILLAELNRVRNNVSFTKSER
ncbi:hypothetical protein EON65_50580 [archaeon]|nr:MAG: hypothetical protein EON65_50580 [archaeon]